MQYTKDNDIIFDLIKKETERQHNIIELIASENIVSQAVKLAQSSDLTNKYAEGYPGARYYGGCHVVDEVEELAIARLKELFNVKYANVQPHSGSQANQAVFFALLSPGDRILGMDLAAGGHLTHGAKPTISGRWFEPYSYGLDQETHLIDYVEVKKIAHEVKPKLIIAGGSSYPRKIDFRKFREIADEVGAYLMIDMAHFAGLVASGLFENPAEYADVVTSTTHKTLRGPRGGVIISNREDLGKKLNSAVFPGIQGGPLMHVIAAKAVCFGEALKPEFKEYGKKVIENMQILAEELLRHNINLVTGGTDSHLLLINLTNNNITGKDLEKEMEEVGMVCNKNAIPFDKLSFNLTSGVRIGSAACTTRGFGENEFRRIGQMIAKLIFAIEKQDNLNNIKLEIKKEVQEICDSFPISS